ncbi:MAG: dephospho-CoA kinase [Robiginitomaculum sp.]
MIIVGLTGSIGMGKTTTAKMFKAAGAAVFDADAAVHELYAKGGAAVPILRAGVPEAIIDGTVDRKKLSAALAKDPLLYGVLESFIHPLVAKMRAAALENARAEGKRVFVNDIPLLFETGGEAHVDVVVVAHASAKLQRERVLARPNMSAAKFKAILARQMPSAQKLKRANYGVNTGKGLAFARERVQFIMDELTKT